MQECNEVTVEGSWASNLTDIAEALEKATDLPFWPHHIDDETDIETKSIYA